MDSKTHHRRRGTALGLGAALAIGIGAGTAAAATPGQWTQVRPATAPLGNLTAVAQVDQHTTWAAGFAETYQGKVSVFRPLLLARDDRTSQGWHEIPTPAASVDSRINALAARGASDAWLVGDNQSSGGRQGTPILTEHWNGASWQPAYAPVPSNTLAASLLGVTVLGPRDAWAVGTTQIIDSVSVDPVTGLTDVVDHNAGLLEHWDGTSWRQVSGPASLAQGVLTAVSATAPDDLWATGFSGDDEPIALHYDGRAWAAASLPNTGLYGELEAVTARGADDVWAVGRTVQTTTDSGHPLVEHWNGHCWKQVNAPGNGQLLGATLVDGDLAVVGYDAPTGTAYGQRLAGGRWTSLDLPALGTGVTGPEAITGDGDGLTVTGAYDDNGQPGPLPLLLTSAP